MNLKKMAKTLINGTKKNSPAILTGLAVAGLLGTVIAAWKAAPKAQEIILGHREKMEHIKDEDKQKKREITKETVKKLAPVVLPVAIMGVSTASCIIGANTISSKRIAVLSTAYTLAEKSVNDLNAKMKETLGEGKTRAIKDAIIKDKVKGSKPNNVIITGDGDVLCLDEWSGRYFKSNAQKIQQAFNVISADVARNMYTDLNAFYDEIGLDPIDMGYQFGWNCKQLDRGILPMSISAVLTNDNTPCLVASFDIAPIPDFRDLY